jgi:hypothetical protein
MNYRKIWITNFQILIFSLAITLQAMAQEKTITIQEDNISLKDVFASVEKQTSYSIAYKQSEINDQQQISLSLKNSGIDNALIMILKNTGLTYRINGYHIILIPTKDKTENKKIVLTQVIRGIVYDLKTRQPIEYANISLLDESGAGTKSDSLGHFVIKGIPLGYVNIKVTFIGYESYVYREILLVSAQEAYLEIPLKEIDQALGEVFVHPQINKEHALNPMALSEGRMLSVEEANRFAGTFNDPARLVTSFAGVSGTGGIASNAISVRGNTPQYTQWRLEGVEIPNPTHFADMISLGGGIYSALSSQVMGNSDFFNGTLPSEYSNVLSGVFDMQMRNGNNQKYQNTFQASLIGIDMASEGPLNKNHNSSYIFNYRYSVTGLVMGADLKYQDLSFKLNFPTRNAGTFSIWGLGLTDRNKAGSLDKNEWKTFADRQDVKTELGKAIGGITHRLNIDNATYIKTSLSGTYSGIMQNVGQVDSLSSYTQVVGISNKSWNVVLNSFINKKFSSKHMNRSGFTATGLIYNLDYNITPNYGMNMPMENIVRSSGDNFHFSAFSNSVFSLSPNLSTSAGINLQYFDLDKNFLIEPRLNVQWNLTPKQSLSVAYGLHSRRERLDYYYVRNENNQLVNKDLKLAKAHHFNLTYDWGISDILHLKIEPYYQYLYDVPVEANTSFSVLNLEDYYLDKALNNDGKGRNYGIDFTLERYMNKGYYYLFAGSVFRSEYMGGDNIWRKTRYARGYSFNGVWGKDWVTGRNKNNMIGLNLRLTYQGGDRYTPIDQELSEASHEIVLDDSRAFSNVYNPYVNGDVTFSYRINKKKVSHEFALKGLNIGIYTGQYGYQYNENSKSIEKLDILGTLWDICYKIHF